MKIETISFGSGSPAGGELDVSTKEVPVVHTETKTITYESSQVSPSVKTEPLALQGFFHLGLRAFQSRAADI